jgi:WD40 repeat protein
MPDPTPARVFVSYSRKDGAAFAAELRETLLKQDLSIWQDIVALEGGRDWWSQIEDTIRSKALQHFVLVVTRAALASPVVRREIRLARQEGKTVSLVKGPGLGDLGKVPRWFGNVYELDRPESLRAFIDRLRRDSQQKRVPMMAPEPPVDFVRRPAEFEALKAKLLDAKGDAVAISAALKGAGGYGKTTLAKALAHDPDIQDAYFDGILWVELGEKPDDLMSRIVDFIETLTGTRPGFQTIDAGAAALGDALGDRRILMIVDDVWREQDLRPFLRGGGNTTRLITTRLNRVLPVDAFRQAVDAMKGAEARELLSGSLPKEEVRAQYDALSGLAGRLGEWAQLLKLVNGFLRERVIEGGERLWDAIGDANERLNEEGFVAFDAEDESDRTRAVARTINLSLGLLDEKQRARFAELAVFPEDADIPIGIVARLWRGSAGLSEGQTKDLLIKLYGLSLLLGLDLNQRTFRFHDTIRRFLQDQAGKAGLAATHKQLLLALDDIGTSPETDALSRRYYYLYLPHHLAEAQERDKLDKLLLDPGWLKAKLSATSSPHALAADYQQYGVGELQNFIGRTLRLTTGILARDPRQLMPQLLGRIMGCKAVGAGEFLEAARRQLSPPAILAERLSLTPPGAETARLEGHSDLVSALCMLPDGRLASSSHDNTIRLWDVTAGAETSRLEEHPNGVGPLCMLPDGRVALGSEDNTIRLWDVTAGAETARLEGHSHWVQALCVLPDGRVASSSWDKTIRLWDVATGIETARLEGHSNDVLALCVLPDGRLASGPEDNTVRLWDVKAGAVTARLEGHSDRVRALCVLPDGRLASGSDDNTIRLWDVTAGAETARLGGHSGWVTALCMLLDGRLASGSEDNTILLWDVTAGTETARLEGHSRLVTALCMLPDGRLASGSGDNTIRCWNVADGADTARLDRHSRPITALCILPDGRLAPGAWDNTIRLWDVTAAETARLEGHSGPVAALCALPDGHLASGSWDNTIRVWDVTAGAEIARLEGHSDLVAALCALPDGRLVSRSSDNTIRLWDVTAGAEAARLKEHPGSVRALCALPDGRLASGSWDSWDNTIRLWDVKAGAETARLEGHSALVAALCVLPDGRLASGSYDNTIRLWEVTAGAETARLEGHSGSVEALCVLPDGRLASGSEDNTIRLWDVTTGAETETARLEVDAPITCVVALAPGRLVAGDAIGRLHWLEIVD